MWLNAGFNCVRQTVMGGRVNSRWLQARDLNLYLDFQERMITADSLLRYQLYYPIICSNRYVVQI